MSNAPKFVPPSIRETAFNCPHCGALAKQNWFELRAQKRQKDETPIRLSADNINHDAINNLENPNERQDLIEWVDQMVKGLPFIRSRKQEFFGYYDVYMLDLAECYNCNEISIWAQSSLCYPLRGDAPLPNTDLPDDIRADFDEAGRIFRISPRGAAALLRLAIQKLCQALGGKGRNIDDDIAQLVKSGLDIRIQRSLDIVRVIGNEAVHPGQIDLRDDASTAEQLFRLVNIIADAMISQPKHINDMYAELPENKRAAIEKRDASAQSKP